MAREHSTPDEPSKDKIVSLAERRRQVEQSLDDINSPAMREVAQSLLDILATMTDETIATAVRQHERKYHGCGGVAIFRER